MHRKPFTPNGDLLLHRLSRPGRGEGTAAEIIALLDGEMSPSTVEQTLVELCESGWLVKEDDIYSMIRQAKPQNGVA